MRFSIQAFEAKLVALCRSQSSRFSLVSGSLGAREAGHVPCLLAVVIANSPKPADSVQQQVEALIAVAKKLGAEGKVAQALETYKTASGLMLGAPWLQHRTAELARKLRQPEVATLHYRRAAAAFIRAGFPKRALSPLRTAWQLSISSLPSQASPFITLSLELSNVQRELGFAADAKLTVTNSNLALETSGSAERVPTLTQLEQSKHRPAAASGSEPPDSGVISSVPGSSSAVLSRLEGAVKP